MFNNKQQTKNNLKLKLKINVKQMSSRQKNNKTDSSLFQLKYFKVNSTSKKIKTKRKRQTYRRQFDELNCNLSLEKMQKSYRNQIMSLQKIMLQQSTQPRMHKPKTKLIYRKESKHYDEDSKIEVIALHIKDKRQPCKFFISKSQVLQNNLIKQQNKIDKEQSFINKPLKTTIQLPSMTMSNQIHLEKNSIIPIKLNIRSNVKNKEYTIDQKKQIHKKEYANKVRLQSLATKCQNSKDDQLSPWVVKTRTKSFFL